MGTAASHSRWIVAALIPIRPQSTSWLTSRSRTRASSSPDFWITIISPRLPTVAPCSWTYSGRASSCAGYSRRTGGWAVVVGSAGTWRRASVSSGKQMPLREQPLHLALSSSGSGSTVESAAARASSM